MKKTTLPLVLVSVAVLALALYSPDVLLAQKGGGKGGGGGGRPGEETTMNLSYPANFFGTSPQTGIIGTFTLGGMFTTDKATASMSYGCLKPETIGTTTYPNTSCVDDTGNPQTPEDCVAPGGKCADFAEADLELIYWQKTTSNKWQAGYVASSEVLPVEYVDWGDNLEGKTWPVQVLRVETNTFSTVTGTYRFDMWHVFGQGTNELWGVHATNEDSPVPYVYSDESGTVNWPFAVNVASNSRLNIAKLEADPSSCPVAATGSSQSPYVPNWIFDEVTGRGRWEPDLHHADILYGAELNIKGSYVFGYNWNVRSEPVPGDISRAGWWRLTFYTPDQSINFIPWMTPAEAETNTLAPPLSEMLPAPINTLAATEAESETGLLLYVPVIDKINNLTYLDICIKEGKAGGSGKKPQ